MKTRGKPRRLGTAAVVQTVMLTAVTVSPTFLMGSVAVQMRDDIGLGPAGIGIGAAVMFGTGGLLAPFSGRIVQRIGPRKGMLFAALTAAAALGGIAIAPDFLWLSLWLVLAGAGNALGQPATNMALSEAVPFGRLGIAMGMKQASIPTASLLGGLAVPAVALVFGWRWAFASAAASALLVALWAMARRASATMPVDATGREEQPETSHASVALLTIGGGLAAAASTCLGIFLVDSAVRSGVQPGSAGILFAGAAIIGLVSRVGGGAFLDGQPFRSPYILVCQLLALGTIGFVLLAMGQVWAVLVGAIFAYGAGWAWPGVLHYGVVRDRLNSVGTATGSLQVGLSLGAAVGPFCFGLLAEASSYGVSWLAASVVLGVSAGVIGWGHVLETRIRNQKVPALDSLSD